MRIGVLSLLDDIRLNICDQFSGNVLAGQSYCLVCNSGGLEIFSINRPVFNSIKFSEINKKLGMVEDIEFLSDYFGCITRLILQHSEEEIAWLVVIPDDLPESSVRILIQNIREIIRSNVVISREYGLIAGLDNGQNAQINEAGFNYFTSGLSKILSNSNSRLLFRVEEETSALDVGIINDKRFIKLFSNINELPVKLICRLSPEEKFYREDSHFITFVGEWQNKKRMKIAQYDISVLNHGPGSVITILTEFGYSYNGIVTFTDTSGSSVKYEISLPRLIYGV